MSNYLNQLVAKNLNQIDTVQPFLLSVFGFLPESPGEMGSAESWGINQEIVMGGGGDSTMTTELETSPEAQRFTNSDMVQSGEWRALATQLKTSGDINNSPATGFGLTPTPNQYSEQPATATSFLANKSDSVSSAQTFPQPVEILPTTDRISPTPNTQLFSSSSAYSGSGQFTDKESEAISSPGVPQTKPVTKSGEPQPVETYDAVSLSPSPKGVSSQPSLTPSKSEPVTRETTTAQVPPTNKRQPLTLESGGKTNIPLSEPTGIIQKQDGLFLSKQPEAEISPSSKVIREKFAFHQSQPDSVASAPPSSEVLGALNTKPLMPGLRLETNTGSLQPAVEQLTRTVTESEGLQSLRIHETDSLSPSSKVVSSQPSLTQPKLEPVTRETTTAQVPPTNKRQPLTSQPGGETNTPLSEPTGIIQKQDGLFLSKQPEAEISPSSKVMREKFASHQSQPDSVASASPSSEVPGALNTKPLMPGLRLETNTVSLQPAVEQLTQPVTESEGLQPVKIHETDSFSPSSKVMREKFVSHQSQPDSVASALPGSEVLGALNTKPLMPGLTVEANTGSLQPAVEQLTRTVTESEGLQSLRIHETDSLSPSSKVVSSQPSLTQSLSEPVPIKRTSNKVPTQKIVTVQPTSHFLDRLTLPNPNILKPIDNDTRRGSAVISTSQQKPQQRESLGNSTTPPTIQVSIGRMEIRTPPPPPPPRPKPRPKPPVMSLDEYLRQRSRGR